MSKKNTHKELVKKKLAERRKFYDFLAKQKRYEDILNKLRLRGNTDLNKVTFSFSPTELGIKVTPTIESIQKLGLKRALERLDRRDFYVNYPYTMDEPVTPESFERHRLMVLQTLKAKTIETNTNISVETL